jgi:putative zinc finger protein
MTYKKEPNCGMHEAMVSYLYGEATADETREVQAHLAKCDACSQELESFERVRGMLQQWQLDDLPVVRVITEGPRPSVIGLLRELFSIMPIWSKAIGALATAVFVLAVMGTRVSFGGGQFSLDFDLLRRQPPSASKTATSVAPNVDVLREQIRAYAQQLIVESESKHNEATSSQLSSLETQIKSMRAADLAKLASRIEEHQQRLQTIERDIDRREGLDLTDILFSEATENHRSRPTVSGGE